MPENLKLQEYELIKKAQEGDNSAFNFLIKKYFFWLRSVILKFQKFCFFKKVYLSFEDLKQAALWGAWDAVKSFDFSKKVSFITPFSWQAKKRMWELFREEQKSSLFGEIVISVDDLVFERAVSYFSSPRERMISLEWKREAASFLKEALSLVSESQREIIIVRCFSREAEEKGDFLSFAEVSKILGKSYQTISESFKRALRTISKSYLLQEERFNFFS